MSPTISVIVPIYNMEELLRRCLDSLVEQSYANLEIILVNDGSTDSSPRICDDYANKDHRIKIIHKPNGGVSAARNSALDIATGDYLSFVDPDDWIESNTYADLAKYAIDSNADVIRFNAYKNGDILNELPFRGLYESEKLRQEVLLPMIGSEQFGGMFILGVLWMHLYKREIIEGNNIRFNTSLHRCEDRLFTISSIIKSQKMLFVDLVLYHYEMNDTSLSNRYDKERWNQELIYMSELKNKCVLCPDIDEKKIMFRLRNDYLLRAMVSIHHEFFSDNNNSFFFRYRKVSFILNDEHIVDASKEIRKVKLKAKDNLILLLMKYRCSLIMSIFESLILFVNKLR